ncbi:hypothetical protein RSAG8_04056, partial [Rhizoctonia solani AG-8 WAC10335]
MFGVAGCLYLRLRRRQREFEGGWEHVQVEKDVGAVWGRAWGSDERGGAWRKRQKMINQEYGGDGHSMSVGSEVVAPAGVLPAPAARFRQGPMGNPSPGNESAERLIERPGKDGGPSSFYPSTRPNTNTPINPSITYPVNARYLQTRGPNKIPDIDTRALSSDPNHRNVNTRTNDDTNNKPTSNGAPTGKLKRLVPAPSPYVYAPPQEATPEPVPQASYSTNPFSTRPTSPYRAASPYGSHTSNHGRKVLSKQRAPVLPPSTSAFMRHINRRLMARVKA